MLIFKFILMSCSDNPLIYREKPGSWVAVNKQSPVLFVYRADGAEGDRGVARCSSRALKG